MELKTWKWTSKWSKKLKKRVHCPGRRILVCLGKKGTEKCGVRYQAPKAYTPMHNTTLTFKGYLLLGYSWSTQKRIDQTTVDLRGIVTEDQVARVFSSLRDISGWYVCDSTKTIIFNKGEVDLDAKVTHVSHEPGQNMHKGRLFIQRERSTKKRKVTTMPDRGVGIGSAGFRPPPSWLSRLLNHKKFENPKKRRAVLDARLPTGCRPPGWRPLGCRPHDCRPRGCRSLGCLPPGCRSHGWRPQPLARLPPAPFPPARLSPARFPTARLPPARLPCNNFELVF